jgi:acetoin utilization deacetylase AcuC-like enzyme
VTRRLGFVWNERYAWHDQGPSGGVLPAGGWIQPEAHAESAESKRRLRNLLEASGFIDELTALHARAATEEEVCRFHDRAYVERIRDLSADRGGDAGFGSMFSAGGYEIALLAAGGCIVAVDAVLDSDVDVAYALVRPPGHHATRESGMGFCLFGNVAIATMHARAARGVGRVAIVDWDVHHGNGTQAAFYGDPDVLTISIHQDRSFPADTGAVTERGQGTGVGANINVPLPPGSGRGAYDAAFERIVVPAIRRHRPEMIVIACGFDASGFDPLGRMMLSSGAYRKMTATLLWLADELCDGRLVACHEGGYSTAVVPFCGLAVIETLVGHRSGVEDPFEPLIAGSGGQELQPHQLAMVERAAAAVDGVPAPSGA